MRKGKSLVTIATVICAAALSFQVALSAPKTANLDIAELNLQTATIVKRVSSANNETAENYSAASKKKVTTLDVVSTSEAPEITSAVKKENILVFKNSDTLKKQVSEMNPILGKSFIASYLVNDICIDVYFESVEKGLKELVFEYDSLSGERKSFKPGLYYDETNLILFGKDEKGMMGSGFDFDHGQKMFFYSEDVFQRDFGFCEIYDIMSPLIFDDLVTTRIKFNYEGMDWMVQLWKGRYITTMGGEIGIYNKPESRNVEFYDCGRDQDKMPMSMSVLKGDEVLFTKKTETCWWQTGFVFREFCAPEALTLKGAITFPTVEMKNAFTAAADKMTTGKIAYTVVGNAVSFVW